MSHFSKIQTTLKDLNVLKQSLTDLSIQWDAQSQIVRGYKEKTSFANLVIKQNNNYDIGFTWNGFEYQLVADLQFWQQPWSVESFLDKVSQRYAYNSIIQATGKQGFEAVEEVNQENGTIRLTLQRWNPSA
uniref:Uncharacterized protein ycf35 n=1 Tax=Storeatula sp. CCMP1868 TaxID=195070 RepID=A0A222AHN5_9CRYP|nr:Ycf35 [Storeatula sp. CCMP1868]